MTLRLRALAIGVALGGLCLPGGASLSASSAEPRREGSARATFAGGCFWCMEPPFDKIPGVVSTTSGYAGGTVVNPTYEQVAAGGAGDARVVHVVFDPPEGSYEKLPQGFLRNLDPFDGG